jgi:hypothetical protein
MQNEALDHHPKTKLIQILMIFQILLPSQLVILE